MAEESKNLVINHIANFNYSDLNIIGAGYEKTSKDKSERSVLDFKSFSFHFVISGKGYYKIEGKKYKLKKNSIFCIFPSTKIEYGPDIKYPWTYYWINFSGTKVFELLERANITPEKPIIEFVDGKTGRLFIRNVIECQEHQGISDLVALSNLYRIFFELIKEDRQTNDDSKKPSTLSNMAIAYINENYSDVGLNIQLVAMHCNVTPAHLSRVLKKTTGATFTTNLTLIRMKAAIQLIENGWDRVNEIAHQVGYDDPYYFSNLFKKYNSCSPKQLIKKVADAMKQKKK